MKRKAGYLLFVDESGSHGMHKVDPDWPLFVLVGLLVGEKYYQQTLVPRVKSLKDAHGIPRDCVLHSRSIRRWEAPFDFLCDPKRREAFYEDLNALIRGLRLRACAVVVDKRRLARRYIALVNPYDISLNLLMGLVCGPPGAPSLYRPTVNRIIAESRGKVENRQLQGEYRSFRAFGLTTYGVQGMASRRPRTVRKLFPDRVDFVKKSRVVSGLELTDLMAYPIGRAVLSQSWDNPAYQIVADKLRGIVVFP